MNDQRPWGWFNTKPLSRIAFLLTAATHVLVVSLQSFYFTESTQAFLNRCCSHLPLLWKLETQSDQIFVGIRAMTAAKTMNLASGFPSYYLEKWGLILILIDHFSGRLCHLETRVYKALKEYDEEFMGILLSSNRVSRPNSFELVNYLLRVCSSLFLYALQVLSIQAKVAALFLLALLSVDATQAKVHKSAWVREALHHAVEKASVA